MCEFKIRHTSELHTVQPAQSNGVTENYNIQISI